MCITSHLPISNFFFIILSNYLVFLSLTGVPCSPYWSENLGSLNNIILLFTWSYRWLINVFNNKDLFWYRSPGSSAIKFILHPQLDLTPILPELLLCLFSFWSKNTLPLRLWWQSFLISCLEDNLSKFHGVKKSDALFWHCSCDQSSNQCIKYYSLNYVHETLGVLSFTLCLHFFHYSHHELNAYFLLVICKLFGLPLLMVL